MLLKWDPIYSVNVSEIDNQHKKMFGIINQAHALCKEKIDKRKIFEIVKELNDYGSYHLKTEEKYFDKFKYPDAKFHISQHNNYKKRISELEANLRNCQDEQAREELSVFLRDWWLEHIQGDDQKYSTFFNKNGLF